jgi:hypothetical protein
MRPVSPRRARMRSQRALGAGASAWNAASSTQVVRSQAAHRVDAGRPVDAAAGRA